MRIERILVVGGTGLIGVPVARRLLDQGHHVRLLVRDPTRASQQLGGEFEYAEGSVTDDVAVDRAVQGMDGVHVSLGVEDPAQSKRSSTGAQLPSRRQRRGTGLTGSVT